MDDRDHIHHVLDQWRREAPSLNRSALGVIGRISRLAELLQAQLEPVFASHGLTGGEFDVLSALRRAGPPYMLTPTALSNALLVSSGGMTKRLLALEQRGLIGRRADPRDGRSRSVTLTAAGKRLVDAAMPDHVTNEETLLAGLSHRERTDIAALLERLALSLGDGSPRSTAPTPGRSGAAAARHARSR